MFLERLVTDLIWAFSVSYWILFCLCEF